MDVKKTLNFSNNELNGVRCKRPVPYQLKLKRNDVSPITTKTSLQRFWWPEWDKIYL